MRKMCLVVALTLSAAGAARTQAVAAVSSRGTRSYPATWIWTVISQNLWPGTELRIESRFYCYRGMRSVKLSFSPSLEKLGGLVSVVPAEFPEVLAENRYAVEVIFKAPPEFSKKQVFAGELRFEAQDLEGRLVTIPALPVRFTIDPEAQIDFSPLVRDLESRVLDRAATRRILRWFTPTEQTGLAELLRTFDLQGRKQIASMFRSPAVVDSEEDYRVYEFDFQDPESGDKLRLQFQMVKTPSGWVIVSW